MKLKSGRKRQADFENRAQPERQSSQTTIPIDQALQDTTPAQAVIEFRSDSEGMSAQLPPTENTQVKWLKCV